MDLDKIEQAFLDTFYLDFTNNAGLIALFSTLKFQPNSVEKLNKILDFWINEKKKGIQQVAKRVVDANNFPENYSVEELYTFSSIEPEDYTACANKALFELKNEIMENFKNFLKETK
jgi:hypothetical protein